MVVPQKKPEFEVKIKNRLEYVLFSIIGEFTVKNLFHVRTHLQEILENSVSNIVFDLSECTEIDSSGLGILGNLYKKLSGNNGELGMLNVPPKIQKILNETGLTTILTFFNSQDEAESHFD